MSDTKERGRLTGDELASLVHGRDAANVRSLLCKYNRGERESQDSGERGDGRARRAPTAGNYVGANRIKRQPEPLGGDDAVNVISEHESLAAPRGAVMVDYLRAVLPSEAGMLSELAGWLGAFDERPIGWRGWYTESASVLDGGLVAWCRDESMAERQGVLVDLPGRACAALGERLVPFMRWCAERGRVRRVDFALDDRRGDVTYERLAAAVDAGALVTRARGVRWIVGKVAESGERIGWTLYIGSRSSEACIRIYDKRLERIERGAGDCGGHWIRCELEATGDFADALAREVLKSGAAVVVEQLNRRARFTEPSATDESRERWPMASWWYRFVGSVERGASLMCGEDMSATIERMLEYVRLAAAPAMAAITEARGGDVSWFYELLDDGQHRLKSKHHAAIRVALAEAAPG